MSEEVKELIIEYLNSVESHPTAEDIYNVINPKIGKIDKNIFIEGLNHLEKKKYISYVLSFDNKKHYDIKTYNHYHFICENCGMIRDVLLSQEAIQMLTDHVQMKINSYAKISKINLSFQGSCHNCKKNKIKFNL